MTTSVLTIGNFALSDIYKDGDLVIENELCGTNFRIIIAFLLLGFPADFITAIGQEPIWDKILNIFKKNQAYPQKIISIPQSIKFVWYYQGSVLKKLDFNHEEKSNEIIEAINNNEVDISKYKYVNICPLGYENEKQIFAKLNSKKQIISYIFHYSNLEHVDTKKYLEIFKKVNYLFLNKKEALALTGESSLIAAGNRLSMYAKNCFITNEDKGLKVFNNGRQILTTPAFKINYVDSSGAGDILAGGIIASLFKGEKLREACNIGTMLAGLSLMDYLTINLNHFLFKEIYDNQ